MTERLISAALKKIVAIRIAEFLHSVKEEYGKIDSEEKHADESVTGFHTELADPKLLDDQIVAKPFGFGISTTGFKDGIDYTVVNRAEN